MPLEQLEDGSGYGEGIPSDPPHFSSAYHKVHKQYGIFAALLFVWELIGVDVDNSPALKNYVILKSPQAVPWVLVVMVLYFCFRFTVEWHQSSARRRKLAASRIDYRVAHGIA